MYFETWKFYSIVYSLAMLWCCMIRANGETDTNIALNSSIFKILSGIQNGTRVNPLISIFYVNIGNGPFNLNIPLNVSGSNTNPTEHEKTTQTVTEPIEIVTESIQTVTESIQTVTEPIEIVTEPIQSVPEDYILAEGIGYHKLHKTRRTWDDAREACTAENADLAVINSAKEKEMLSQLMRDNGNVYMAYIGAYYNNENIGWMTVTGLSSENAGLRLPSVWWNQEFETSQCVVIYIYSHLGYYDCSDKYYYICEIPL